MLYGRPVQCVIDDFRLSLHVPNTISRLRLMRVCTDNLLYYRGAAAAAAILATQIETAGQPNELCRSAV